MIKTKLLRLPQSALRLNGNIMYSQCSFRGVNIFITVFKAGGWVEQVDLLVP